MTFKLSRFFTLVFFIFVTIVIIYSTFNIKYQVKILNDELTELKLKIKQEKESVNVLSAELSYLNQPHRLKMIAEKYLKHYKPIQVSQINKYIKEIDVAPTTMLAQQEIEENYSSQNIAKVSLRKR